MDQTPNADGGDAHVPPVEIDVARTGGFAGLTRRWSAQPPEDEASDWIVLIDRCPWDDAAPAEETAAPPKARKAGRAPVADGFVWWIRATWSSDSTDRPGLREAELADDQVTGAWRDLVDAVRAWSSESSERAKR